MPSFQKIPEVDASQSSLNQWEKLLAPLFEEIHLLGELPLGHVQRKVLAQAIRDLVHERGLTKATRTLKKRYPRVFLTYLAMTAARNEELGFWDVVAKEMAMPQANVFFNRNHHWGRIFRKLLPRFNLESFPDVRSGHKYLTIIRLHGGIPAYSLPDFFEEILLPAVRKSEYAGLTTSELTDLVLERAAVQQFVDSPVRYFLEHGGQTAEAFFERALVMARAWDDEGRTLTATELGLPRYVVRAFQQFMERRLQTPRGKRLRAPRLHFEPYDFEYIFSVELPEQPIDIDIEKTSWHYEWRLIVHTESGKREDIDVISVRKRSLRGDIVTQRQELHSLDLPPGQLRVAFLARHADQAKIKTLGRWYFDLTPPPGEAPVLAFHPRNGQPVRQDVGLPATELWLLLPSHLHVQARPQGRLVEEVPTLGGQWARWKVELWDLEKARSLLLVDPETAQSEFEIPISAPITDPYLFSENRVDEDLDTDRTPLFAGEPPRLWLPRLTDRELSQELADWRLRIRAIGSVYPLPHDHELRLDALSEAIIEEEEGIILPLTQVLGERIWGTYVIELRGPRRLHTHLAFRAWPDLTLNELAAYYLPGPQGAEPISFYLQGAPDDQLWASEEKPGVQVEPQPTPGGFRIQLDPDVCIATLYISRDFANEAQVQIPLHLRAPRLRWLIRLGEEEFPWMTSSINIPADKLLQSRPASLILALEGARTVREGRLLLLDAENMADECLQEESLPGLAITNRVAQDLLRFFDTIRAYGDRPSLILALKFEEHEESSLIPLLSIERGMAVNLVLPEWLDEETLVIHWEAEHRLRNRRVRLWSAWRPWEPSREYAIPDDIQPELSQYLPGSGAFRIPEPLSFGAYWVAFRTAPSWDRLSAPLMPPKENDCFLLGVDDEKTQAHLQDLQERNLSGKVSPFLTAFERACIFHIKGIEALRNREIKNALDKLIHGSPQAIIALNQWLQEINSLLASKVRTHMYRPKALRRLFGARVSRDIQEAYLADFHNMNLVKEESARLILRHSQNPELRAHAIEIILRRIRSDDIAAFVNLVEEDILSECLALDLLSRDPDLAILGLNAMPPNPVRDSLLDKMVAETRADVVLRAGIWVRSEAGWGQLDQLLEDGEIKPHLILEEKNRLPTNLILKVTLPRHDRVWNVEIDTTQRRIHFLGAKRVWRCTRDDCLGFAAVHEDEVRSAHNRAAHMGIGPAFKHSPPSWRYQHPLTFRWEPQDPYA